MSFDVQNFYIDLRLKNKSNSLNSSEDLRLTKENIEYITISENVLSIVPRIEMMINDVGGLVETFPLLDDDIMTVVISQFDTSDPMVEADFIISDISVDSDRSSENKYTKLKLAGYISCERMFMPYQNRSFRGNSADVLRKIAREVRLKFNNKLETQSNDNMIWYQDSENFSFIKHMVERSYIPDDALFFYGTCKQELVYTGLIREMRKEEDFVAHFNRERVENFVLLPEDRNNLYYDAYDILNITGLYNKMGAYGASFGQYNLKGDLEGDLITRMDKFTDLSNKNKLYDGVAASFNNVGIQSNPNVFDEYSRGIVQNYYMKYNFFSVSLGLNINSMTDVKLFDKVNLGLPSTLVSDNGMNDVYSGHYLITGITHNITAGGVYQKQILLSRNGINRSTNLKEYNVN